MEQESQLPFAWCQWCASSLQVSKPLANVRVPHLHLLPPRVGNDSGAIYALASFFAFAAPRAKFLLFFVVPMPAWACIGAIACFDVYNAFTRRVRHFLLLAALAETLHAVLYLR